MRRWGCCQRAASSCTEALLVSKILRAFTAPGRRRWAIGMGTGGGWRLSSAKIYLQIHANIFNTMQIRTSTTRLLTWMLHWMSKAKGEAGLYRGSLTNTDCAELAASRIAPLLLSYSKLCSSLGFLKRNQSTSLKHTLETKRESRRRGWPKARGRAQWQRGLRIPGQ